MASKLTLLARVNSYAKAVMYYRGRKQTNNYRNLGNPSLYVRVWDRSLVALTGVFTGVTPAINPNYDRPALVWVTMHSTNIAEFVDTDFHPDLEFAVVRTGGWLSSPTTRENISALFPGVVCRGSVGDTPLRARLPSDSAAFVVTVYNGDRQVTVPEHDMVVVRSMNGQHGGKWKYYAPLHGFNYGNPEPAEPPSWSVNYLTKAQQKELRRVVKNGWQALEPLVAAEILNPQENTTRYVSKNAVFRELLDGMEPEPEAMVELLRRDTRCTSLAGAKAWYNRCIAAVKRDRMYCLNGSLAAKQVVVPARLLYKWREVVAEAELAG